MTDGKLVRDLIPDLIRASGRQADVRHVSGEELVSSLGAKLCEEAQEVVAALDSREKLVEELADVTEVMSALMNLRGIDDSEVAQAATAKAMQKGRFGSGAWLIDPIPASVRRCRIANVQSHRVKWTPERWTNAFVGHEGALAELKTHSEQAGGIARSSIHAHAQADPVDLFLMAMAWGFGKNGFGPHRTQKIMQSDCADEKIAAIVAATRHDGAAAGWTALLTTHKIKHLNMAFGTKLLYFAGYNTEHRPRPLILDKRVRASLHELAPGTVPAKGLVRQADYLRYLDLAEEWASDPTWRQQPDVVEYALFAQ